MSRIVSRILTYRIQLHRANREVVEVWLDPQMTIWTEGVTDWPLDPGFAAFIRQHRAETGSEAR